MYLFYHRFPAVESEDCGNGFWSEEERMIKKREDCITTAFNLKPSIYLFQFL